MKKTDLSECQRELVKMMQSMNFGRIEGLVVRNGDPVFDPYPIVLWNIKLCAENGPRREMDKEDFTLKAQVFELFAYFKKIGNGVIRSLEVKNGLPFRITIEEKAA